MLVERFDPQAALGTMAEHGITVVERRPDDVAGLARLPEAPRPTHSARSGWRHRGRRRLTAEVARAIQERFGLRLHQGYGLTEASPVVTTDAGLDAPVESIGTPLPGIEVRLVDTDGERRARRRPRRDLGAGAQRVRRLLDDDQAPPRRPQSPTDGCARATSASVDDDGLLYIVDRAKDLIIVSGFNVYPGRGRGGA